MGWKFPEIPRPAMYIVHLHYLEHFGASGHNHRHLQEVHSGRIFPSKNPSLISVFETSRMISQNCPFFNLLSQVLCILNILNLTIGSCREKEWIWVFWPTPSVLTLYHHFVLAIGLKCIKHITSTLWRRWFTWQRNLERQEEEYIINIWLCEEGYLS